MGKIRFLNNETESERAVYYCFNGLEQPDKTIKLKFEDEIPSDDILCSGFDIINEYTDENMSGDYYHDYTTIYRRFDEEKTIQLSKDGSVYIEPEIIEPEIHIPTLDEVKKEKIIIFSMECNASIVNGVDVAFTEDYVEHFSYTDEDQMNIKELFDLVCQTNLPVSYHPDNGTCKTYTPEQIIAIYTAVATNKNHHTTYFNQIREYIKALETKEEVDAVTYGQELIGKYLDTYNESMYNARCNIEALLAKRAAVLAEG